MSEGRHAPGDERHGCDERGEAGEASLAETQETGDRVEPRVVVRPVIGDGTAAHTAVGSDLPHLTSMVRVFRITVTFAE